ncbi:MAG: FMN-binding negative transcriptional regulator, partial [Polaromonas sp.]|nr:FMN-binding negative transcriptional regulator [Polaromonas sp.]
MYLPAQFQGDRAQAAALMREHPFASLVSIDGSVLPFITHLPLHLELGEPDATGQQAFTLLGHVARGNPHWRYLQARPQAVVTFLGPHGYLSPQVYPDLARVPTWNYLAVHCTVHASLVEEASAKNRLVQKLIADHEPDYAQQWHQQEPGYVQQMLSGIVGFELQVSDLQCKLKLNQHRPEAFSAIRSMYVKGSDGEQELARWM